MYLTLVNLRRFEVQIVTKSISYSQANWPNVDEIQVNMDKVNLNKL